MKLFSLPSLALVVRITGMVITTESVSGSPCLLQVSMFLSSSEGEEVTKSRVLLLQLMQNCFPMLPTPRESRGKEESKVPDEAGAAARPSMSSSRDDLSDSMRAVWELYTHLCHSKEPSQSEGAAL